MRTSSSSNLPGESSPNPTYSNPKRRNRRRSKQPFILEESPVDTMADQRTMAELLRAPTEGYEEAIVGPLPSNTIANPKGELKSITTRSGLVLDGPSIPMPPPFINPEEDERVEKTLTDPKLGEFTIKVPPPLVQKAKPQSQRNYLKMLKALLSNKEKLLELANTPHNENCSAVILKKLLEKLRDPGKFLISCCSSELKCKALADLEVKDDIFDPKGDIVLIEKLLNLDSTKDLPPPHNIDPLSGSTTFSSSIEHVLEEFVDELALITFPSGNDDLPFDIESDLKEIEYLLNHDPTKEMDSILEDLIDESNLAYPNDNLFDSISEMFTDEYTLDYSSPPIYDDFDDDLFKIESDTIDVYNDPFDSNGEKIKESKLLIDELDLPRSSDLLPSPEYDSFLFEDFFEVDALPSTNNEEKLFNLGILIHENLSEDFDHPLYEVPFHKEVPGSETLLSFSSENKEKVFKPEILTSKGVRTSLLPELSHRGPKAFKVIKIFESPMKIFPCSYGEDIRILDVPNSQILKTRARGFVLRSLESSHPQLHFGNPISKSYRLTFIFVHT
nr:reverse transcriptase domain-containing protein [Tanacetum cinerariifolium]